MVVPDAYKSDGDGGLLGKLVGKVVVWRLGADPGGDWVRGPHQTLPAFLHPLHWRNEWRASIISYSRTQEEI